jgi:hypothetical protein
MSTTDPAPLKLIASGPRRSRKVNVKIIAPVSALRPALDAVKGVLGDATIVLNVLPGDQ